MSHFKKRIVIYSLKYITNYGDPIIGDCCKYLIEKTARENNIRVNVTIAKVYCGYQLYHKLLLTYNDTVVFPGGGMNSIEYCKYVLKIFSMLEKYHNKNVYFNAIGLNSQLNQKNKDLLTQIYNKEYVKQITTRGDFEQLKELLQTKKEYPPMLVFDPALWVNEAYQISRDTTSETIGIGIIHAAIYQKNHQELSEEDVFLMYENIIHELDRRGYRWQLFSNGMPEDTGFGLALLERMGLDKNSHIAETAESPKELVRQISGFRAVIASRLHANIIATSLDIPSIGLVWNVKMNLFAKILGCPERYLQGKELLLDAGRIVDRMEQAIEKGYDHERIHAMKEVTINTIKNILM